MHATKTSVTTIERLRRFEGLAYASPVLGISFLLGPIQILQGIYAKHFGLALTTIAAVLLIARLFDAISDPVIGYLSDRYQARTGSRKPLVASGGIVFIVASYFLYVPPENVSAVYFLSWFLAFYLGFTLFEIPHLAWGSELTDDSRENNKIYGWRAFSASLGSLFFFAIPLLPIFKTNNFTPETLRWSVVMIGVFMIPMLYICLAYVSDGRSGLARVNPANQGKEDWNNLLSSIIENVPLLWFFGAFLFVGIGAGMWLTLLFLFVDSYLGLGEHLSLTYVISYGVSIITFRGWSWLANRWGKQKIWGLAMILIAGGIMGTGALSPDDASLLFLRLSTVLVFSGFTAWIILAPSLLADIIDYGTLKFNRDRAGTYFSLYTLVAKANWSIGGALGLGIAGWYGFDTTVTYHSHETTYGLRLAMVWLPVPMVLLSILFMAMVPINTYRHAIIRRRLNSREKRTKAITDKGLEFTASNEISPSVNGGSQST